jgi:hypothetical protein
MGRLTAAPLIFGAMIRGAPPNCAAAKIVGKSDFTKLGTNEADNRRF